MPHRNIPDPSPAGRDPHNAHTLWRWRCPNCGQTVFAPGDQPPPDRCAYCDDLTTWQRIGPVVRENGDDHRR